MKKAQEASRRAPKSEIEKIFQAEDLLILQKATYLKEQTHDSVKLLNTLGARAAAFTLRDQQIKELETRGGGDALYDTKMNLRMEIDRLEDLKRLEDRETSKKAKRVADRIVLEAQIASRTSVKKQAALKVTAEGEAMLELLRLEAVEEEELEKKKRVKQQVDMKQVMEFNTAAIGIKKQVLETIRLEEEAIATYQLKRPKRRIDWKKKKRHGKKRLNFDVPSFVRRKNELLMIKQLWMNYALNDRLNQRNDKREKPNWLPRSDDWQVFLKCRKRERCKHFINVVHLNKKRSYSNRSILQR